MKQLGPPLLGLIGAILLSGSIALAFYILTDGHAPVEQIGDTNKDY